MSSFTQVLLLHFSIIWKNFEKVIFKIVNLIYEEKKARRFFSCTKKIILRYYSLTIYNKNIS